MRTAGLIGILACIGAACGNPDDGLPDAGGSGAYDATMVDAPPADSTVAIVDAPIPDAPWPDAAPPDATPGPIAQHVHIYIDNFCNTSTSPTSITVAPGKTAVLSYHNHSVDYLADVWMSYGGGYLDLAKGATWNDQFEWCTGNSTYTGYADISIAGGGGSACPGVRFYIYCQ